MYWQELKNKLASQCGVEASDFVYPPQAELGDLSLSLFNQAKILKLKAPELAIKLKDVLENNQDLNKDIKEVRALGPYLNIFLNEAELAKETINEIQKKSIDFGKFRMKSKCNLMIEYSNGNTHKEYHIGHLRNLFFGASLTRLLSFVGHRVIPVSYINDFGIHVAKTLWAWKNSDEFKEQREKKEQIIDKGRFLGTVYSVSSKELMANPEGKDQVSVIMKEIENRNGEYYKLWEETRRWSIDYFDKIYKNFNIHFDHIFYESEVIQEGIKLVDDLLEKKVLIKSQGAIVADLSLYGLGVLPVIRTDGTALYAAADLALADEKFKKYEIDESIYVVDVRQSLYFKQLAKIFDLAQSDYKISHLTYDFVTLKSGMMASRSGNIISYDDILSDAILRAKKEVSSRHDDWSEEKIKQTAESLAKSALSFEMLKVGREKVIVFDVEEALRFDGYTAAYLQYSGARLSSILRKSNDEIAQVDFSLLNKFKEKQILIQLQKFSESVCQAAEKRDPSLIARYLFELAQLFNDYYHSVSILKEEESLRKVRLSLITSIQIVLKNAFQLLGLDYLEEM